MTSPRPVWRNDPKLARLFAALGAPTVDVRAVGGCVRDAVMERDRPDSEIDIGTPEPPDAVTKRLEDAGLRALPTGIAHGTVTALVEGRTFEITSLRRDTACDGRHAAVEFTTDWQEDARRRDFTFNAMSLTPKGVLHDDHDGVADARRELRRTKDRLGRPDDRLERPPVEVVHPRLRRRRAAHRREEAEENARADRSE